MLTALPKVFSVCLRNIKVLRKGSKLVVAVIYYSNKNEINLNIILYFLLKRALCLPLTSYFINCVKEQPFSHLASGLQTLKK